MQCWINLLVMSFTCVEINGIVLAAIVWRTQLCAATTSTPAVERTTNTVKRLPHFALQNIIFCMFHTATDLRLIIICSWYSKNMWYNFLHFYHFDLLLQALTAILVMSG